MAKLLVTAQGIHHSGTDDLIIAVDVRDEEGAPVTGLVKRNFSVWQLGHLFGSPTISTVVALDTIATLEGMYHLVFKLWAPAVDGTFGFRVRVAKGRGTAGDTMTWVVKIGGGPK
jgi:hypothetical protein